MFDLFVVVIVTIYALFYTLLLLLVVQTGRKVVTAEKPPSKAPAFTGPLAVSGIDFLILLSAALFLFFVCLVLWWASNFAAISWHQPWAIVFIIAQILYFFAFLVMIYFLTKKVNWVDGSRIDSIPEEQMPLIVLAYPVLREDENTMHTTMVALSRMDYPKSKYRIIAIPNSDDTVTIEILKRLQAEFPFLEIMEVPPTSDPSWDVVWQAWENNPKVYWFHEGKTGGIGTCRRRRRVSSFTFSTRWCPELVPTGCWTISMLIV